jgi:hypothetical protein
MSRSASLDLWVIMYMITMKSPSAAKLDALQTVSKDRLGCHLGSIDTASKRAIRSAVLFALELDVPP